MVGTGLPEAMLMFEDWVSSGHIIKPLPNWPTEAFARKHKWNVTACFALTIYRC